MAKTTPERIMNIAAGFQSAKIMLAASELGIFETIGGGAMSADELAKKKKYDPEATGILLGALVGLGLLTHSKGKFRNAPDVKRFLTTEGEGGLTCISRHMNLMYDSWAHLDEIVRKGRPKKRPTPKVLTDKKRNHDFICGMFEIGYDTAKLIGKHIDFRGVKKFLDIGGGPAQYPIALSDMSPHTKFTVVDYPNTIKVARTYVKSYGMEDRISLKTCEFFDAADLGVGEDFDIVLLSQVLHAGSDDKCKKLLAKARKALKPGGRIIINENARDAGGMTPPPPLIFAVNMLVNNFGRTFTATELKGWLKEAGFKKVKSKRLHERSLLVEGIK